MHHKIKYLILFLFVNFGGLGFGSWLMNNGPMTSWYQNLNKAPWTPPGWVFGLAWTIIGATFSVFMTNEYENREENPIPWGLFRESLLLNIFWNFIFFAQNTFLAGVVITVLAAIVFLMAHYTRLIAGWGRALWIMPYFLWLMIACSLNWYIVIMN